MALWGLEYFSVIKLGVSTVQSFWAHCITFSAAVFPLIFYQKADVEWRYLMAYGLSFGWGVLGINHVIHWRGVSSGMASLLLDMSVVSGLLVGWFFFSNETINCNKILGCGAGFTRTMLD